MASTITAGNATNGLALSCDNTGILELKTGTGAGTTAVTIDASQVTSFAGAATSFTGNVGIGTSSPAGKLHVNTSTGYNAIFQTSGTTVRVNYLNDAASANVSAAYRATDFAWQKGDGAEVARIDSSGNLLVGKTTTAYGTQGSVISNGNISVSKSAETFSSYSGINNSHNVFYRFDNATYMGGIFNQASLGVSYTTASDYRLKHDIQPMTGALAKVAQLKPVTYKWNADNSESQGFIAHELQEVCPDAVVGEKDAVNEDGSIKPQGIDTSFLVATLTAAIQELKAELDATKAEVAALKGA
jgi:hypothetical protein